MPTESKLSAETTSPQGSCVRGHPAILQTFPFPHLSKQVESRKGTGGSTIERCVRESPNQDGRDVKLAAGGDQRAFERLYRAHVSRVYSLSVRMVGPEWAEDLTQEVFVRAWQKLKTFRGESRFGTWLHRLAVNLLLSRRETLKKRAHLPAGHLLENLTARQAPPGFAVDFEKAVRDLPEGARQVFVLFQVEGYPHQEIAEMMGISEGTSKSQLHRARMMLRKALG